MSVRYHVCLPDWYKQKKPENFRQFHMQQGYRAMGFLNMAGGNINWTL